MTASSDRILTRISPDILDTIGSSFRFSHAKGLSEWLKNALDNYLRLVEAGLETKTGAWPVVLSLIDMPPRGGHPNLALVDFGGTSFDKVDQFLTHWGDRSAATHGGTLAASAVTGGHGNGGKFYMREMWEKGARFATWRDGHVTSLHVDHATAARSRRDGTFGTWEVRNEPVPWRTALNKALAEDQNLGGADTLIRHLQLVAPEIVQELDAGLRGFTVVAGMAAVQRLTSNDVVRGHRWDCRRLLEQIREAPQARRPLFELSIHVLVNGQPMQQLLRPISVDSDPAWEPWEIPLPADAIPGAEQIDHPLGLLSIRKAAELLQGRLRDLNSLVVTDPNGNPVARYHMGELPISGSSSVLGFFQAELRLDLPDLDDLVTNDREYLERSSPKTVAVLRWSADRITEYCSAIEESLEEQQRRTDLDQAAELNRELNEHAQRFLEALRTEMMVDVVTSPSGGGAGSGGTGSGGRGKGNNGAGERQNGQGGREGTGGGLDQPGTTERRQRPEFPRILLSGYDADPSRSDGESRNLTERHPPLFQDPDLDVPFNVWWINTVHPYARLALQRGGPKGIPFKSHQLAMFRDLVLIEALRALQRQQTEVNVNAMEVELAQQTNKFLSGLPRALVDELLG